MSGDESDREILLEDTLWQVTLAHPSDQLGKRMEALLRPVRRRWLGPICGFAAGVIVAVSTITIRIQFLTASRPSSPQLIMHAEQSRETVESRPQYKLMMWVEPRETVDQVTGVIDGVPVELERIRRQTVLWRAGGSATDGPTAILLPEVVTVRRAIHY